MINYGSVTQTKDVPTKEYVDNKVKTDVPVNAKFTDTVYTHPTSHPASMITGLPTSLPASGGNADTVNGKTVGTNVPADAVFTDTVYTHPATHSIGEVSGLQTALNGKVDNSQVLTNVPADAKFTDTVYLHPATHSADMISDGATNKAYTSAEKTKLGGIATNANNYSHPTTHPPSIIEQDASNRFVTDAEKSTWSGKQNALGYTPLNSALKGAASGIAELDANGRIPSSQLPSYVDDVLEYTSRSNFPVTGESGKIYISSDTNLTYRWSGTGYVEISPSIALGETSATAYRGDRGKTAYEHSQIVHNKSLVGLGNVDNTSDANKPISTATQTALNNKVDNSRVLSDVPLNAKFTDTVYTHPANHSPSVISQDSNNRFSSDTEKAAWNAKWDYNENTINAVKVNNAGNADTVNGKTVAENVPSGAKFTDTVYSHPSTHSADMIVDGVSNKVYTATEKTKLAGIATSANNYSHPSTHPASMITGLPTSLPADGGNADTVGGFTVGVNVPAGAVFTDTKTTINGKTGAIAKADIVALGIPAQDTVYTHPTTHPYSMITGTPTSLPASGGHALSATHLLGDDTRAVNSAPSVYMSGGARYASRAGWQTEFKTRTAIDSPLLSGTYVYLQTYTPWSDPSGGYPIQVVYGNGTPCWRVGVSTSAWSAWQSVNDNGNASTVNGFTVGTNVPAGAKFTDTVYTHPAHHAPSIITQDANNRFVTDAEKATWSAKEPAITKNTAFNVNFDTVATNIKKDGTRSLGSLSTVARADHVHPTDTSRAASSHTHTESNIANLTTDLAAKAPLASPAFTGVPTAPTASSGTNTVQLATTAFVQAAVGDMATALSIISGNGG